MIDCDEGCYGDGSLGFNHTAKDVFKLAMSEGWRETEDLDILNRFIDGDMLDDEEFYTLTCIEDDAIDYLNDNCSDEDHYWGYENGDFGYWRINDEE